MVVVLLAEDDEDIAVALTRVFCRSGMTVMHRPDVGMPGTGGWDPVRELRSDDELRQVPIVALSGRPHPGEPRPAERDIRAALLKPCPNDRPLAVVRHLAQDGPQPGCSAATLVGV